MCVTHSGWRLAYLGQRWLVWSILFHVISRPPVSQPGLISMMSARFLREMLSVRVLLSSRPEIDTLLLLLPSIGKTDQKAGANSGGEEMGPSFDGENMYIQLQRMWIHSEGFLSICSLLQDVF